MKPGMVHTILLTQSAPSQSNPVLPLATKRQATLVLMGGSNPPTLLLASVIPWGNVKSLNVFLAVLDTEET